MGMEQERGELVERVERFQLAGAIPDLTPADRCDACTKPASVRAVISFDEVTGQASDLLFCGAHWTVHRARVLDVALLFQDERASQAVTD